MKTLNNTSDFQMNAENNQNTGSDEKNKGTDPHNPVPSQNPEKNPKEPFKNPDPTIPEKGNDIYADEQNNRSDQTKKDPSKQNNQTTDVDTGSAKPTEIKGFAGDNSHKPEYPDSNEESTKETNTDTNEEDTTSPQHNPDIQENPTQEINKK